MKTNSPSGFSYKSTKDGKIFIYHNRRQIMALKGVEASELMGELQGASEGEIQMILAVQTGQYRFGNEKLAKWVRQNKGKA